MGYAGCIVARRALRYSPHESLDVAIELSADCVGQACDPDHTCLTGGCANVSDGAPVDVTNAPSVQCGADGLRCPTHGDVCCLTVDTAQHTSHGVCTSICPSTSIVLNCDDDSDCSEANSDAGPGRCMLAYRPAPDTSAYWTPVVVSDSACLPVATALPRTYGLELCQDRKPCRGSVTCIGSQGEPNLLPGYFWCEINYTP